MQNFKIASPESRKSCFFSGGGMKAPCGRTAKSFPDTFREIANVSGEAILHKGKR